MKWRNSETEELETNEVLDSRFEELEKDAAEKLDRANELAEKAEKHLRNGGELHDPLLMEATEAMKEATEAARKYALALTS